MNLLTGTLPTVVGQLGKIKELMLSRTRIGGLVPTEIGKLALLENLEMYGNKLRGTIPDSLGNCTSLKRIGTYFLLFDDTFFVGCLLFLGFGFDSLWHSHVKSY